MLGEQIKSLRLANKMSQVELAAKLHVSKQTVSNWENNNILPSINLLKRIAEFFHCTSDYLLEMDDYKYHIETTNLTKEQTAHIQQLVADLTYLNRFAEFANKQDEPCSDKSNERLSYQDSD